MLRLSEITGLSLTDLGEIFGMIMGFIIFAVFAGNVLSWMLKEFIDFIVTLIKFLSDLIKEHILDKRKRKKKRTAKDAIRKEDTGLRAVKDAGHMVTR